MWGLILASGQFVWGVMMAVLSEQAFGSTIVEFWGVPNENQ